MEAVEACYSRRVVPKPPSHLKIERARVVVDDAGLKRLTECESCDEEKYIAEGESVCDECKSHGGKVRAKRKRKPKL
jgi:Zn finger protein HypA/HybF involved in hydrogenase expression